MHRRSPARLGLALLTSLFLMTACSTWTGPTNDNVGASPSDEAPMI
jgi:hypothetical protein